MAKQLPPQIPPRVAEPLTPAAILGDSGREQAKGQGDQVVDFDFAGVQQHPAFERACIRMSGEHLLCSVAVTKLASGDKLQQRSGLH